MRAGLERGRPVAHAGASAPGATGGGGGELGRHRARRRTNVLRLPARRRRLHHHGHHSDTGWRADGAGPNRCGAAAGGRARVHRRAAYTGRSDRADRAGAWPADRRGGGGIRARGRRARVARGARARRLLGPDPGRAPHHQRIRGRAAGTSRVRGPGDARRAGHRCNRGCAVGRTGHAHRRGPRAGARAAARAGARGRHGARGVSRRRRRPPDRAASHASLRHPRARSAARPRGGRGATVPIMTDETPVVHTVVKVGGGLLGTAGAFQLVIEALTAFRRGRRLVVLPGGGPFAEAVRQMFKRVKIGEDAAHWMAVLGMDQYAHALAARLPEAALVDGDGGISAAIQAGRLPVLAPYHWLRAADPLPHSWEVTSDTIAAWLAGQLGARRVVLIKPAHALDSKAIVDSYFLRTLPHGVEHLIITADDLGQLDVALREGPPPDRDSKGGRRAG